MSGNIQNTSAVSINTTMDFTVQKPNAARKRFVLGLEGITGGGKTTSALLLAHGILAERYPDLMKTIAKDSEGRYTDFSPVSHLIGLIDTEHGRSNMSSNRVLNSNEYTFKIGEFSKIDIPEGMTFTDNYIGAKNALVNAGCEIIIVDSASHWWETIKDSKQQIDESVPKSNSYANWGKMTPAMEKFKKAFTADENIDVILCYRQKIDRTLEEVNGKTTVVTHGTKSKMKDDFIYEQQLSLTLEEGHKIKVTKDNTNIFFDGEILSPSHGIILEQWRSNKAKDRDIYIYRFTNLLKKHGQLIVNLKTDWLTINKLDINLKVSQLNDIQVAQLYDYVQKQISLQVRMV